jgi:hypothetical protein
MIRGKSRIDLQYNLIPTESPIQSPLGDCIGDSVGMRLYWRLLAIGYTIFIGNMEPQKTRRFVQREIIVPGNNSTHW